MRFTAIVEDGVVIIDGRAHKNIDMFSVPAGTHAIQWYEDHGEIEKSVNGQMENISIDSLDAFQDLIDQWNIKEQERINKENDPFYGMSAQEARDYAYESKLAEIDQQTRVKQAKTFTYNDVEFYAAPKDINFIMATLARESSSNITWKSASKEEDGITNVYVTFTPEEFKAFADALYDSRAYIWAIGDAKKAPVKEMYANENVTPQQILNYDIGD